MLLIEIWDDINGYCTGSVVRFRSHVTYIFNHQWNHNSRNKRYQIKLDLAFKSRVPSLQFI